MVVLFHSNVSIQRPYGWIWFADLIFVLIAEGAFPIAGAEATAFACAARTGGIIELLGPISGIKPVNNHILNKKKKW